MEIACARQNTTPHVRRGTGRWSADVGIALAIPNHGDVLVRTRRELRQPGT
jgi:hypothetical protein